MSSIIGYGATGANKSLKGTGYDQITMPNKSPQQMDLFNIGSNAMQSGMPAALQQLMQMAGGGNEDYWKQLEAPAMRQFGALQGNIASRFSGQGMGARKSSGFQNTMTGEATDLAERLQSNRMGLQQGAIKQLMSLYSDLMGQDLNTHALVPKKKSWWQDLLSGLGDTAGQMGGFGLSKSMGIF